MASRRLTFEQPLSVQLERPRLDSNNSTFLLELFPPCFEHLIVGCLFHPICDQLFANTLLVVARPRTIYPVTAIIRRDFPFILHFSRLLTFFRRRWQDFAQQLASSLVPVGIGKFLRFVLYDY